MAGNLASISACRLAGEVTFADRTARPVRPSLRYALKTVTADASRVFIVYERHVADEPPMLVAECFALRDGRIAESRVFHG